MRTSRRCQPAADTPRGGKAHQIPLPELVEDRDETIREILRRFDLDHASAGSLAQLVKERRLVPAADDHAVLTASGVRDASSTRSGVSQLIVSAVGEDDPEAAVDIRPGRLSEDHRRVRAVDERRFAGRTDVIGRGFAPAGSETETGAQLDPRC
jgi:hypothetical protein